MKSDGEELWYGKFLKADGERRPEPILSRFFVRKKAEKLNKNQSIHDPLCKLHNGRFFYLSKMSVYFLKTI